MTITEFLLARIAEDKERATWHHRLLCLATDYAQDDPADRACTCGYPARVLADCEAKWRIVEHCEPDLLALSHGDEYVLQLLASVYADHPDFDPEWRLRD